MRSREADGIPVVDPGDLEPAREATVAGVVLAAGTSSRYGDSNKLLAEVDGEAMVRHAVRATLASAVDSVTVVVGHEADRVRAALEGLDVEVAENPDYAEGQATSVRRGVEAVRKRDADAVLFALGDMPFVDPSSITALVTAYRAGAGEALAAAFEGERGNPVLFDSRFFDALADVEGDVGAREILLEEARAALVETGDPGVLEDVDTDGDLDRLT